MAVCNVCFRHCSIEEGKTGFCGARKCADGRVVCGNYGRITSAALDPIEKKPLARFCPGSLVLSVGSYGCNLRCPFCQNSEISWSAEALASGRDDGTYGGLPYDLVPPEKLADLAEEYKDKGNIGVAFTYNEPLIGWEYVRDAAKLVHERGMKNVLVTNGTASRDVFDAVSPYIDAMNIDLKGFTKRYYDDLIGGDFGMTKEFIQSAVKTCHVELTTLIIPGENDSEDEMRDMCAWIAALDPETPLHISRFFPAFHMTDRAPTDVGLIYRLADVAREYLKYVYTGNC